ncbi:PadR family transcriptional regulator [Aeromicrobium sp.]|uniref:PadR family transcriptional regulator n=1 Tax=Aeromicrobium sp. TaxID=1871063 RepID=UPI003D6A75FD
MRKNDPHQCHPDDRRRGRREDLPYLGVDLGGGFGYSGRRRGRRRGGRGGDVRAAALLLLANQPAHGYQLIQEIGELSKGAWTPSPGSIYPVLQQLEDEGLIEFDRVEGRKTATLTDAGREYVEEHRDELGIPWEDATRADERSVGREAGEALKGLVVAWRQVMHTGNPAQQTRASAVLDDARRAMYGILADEES